MKQDLPADKEEAKKMSAKVPSHTWTTHADTAGEMQAMTMNIEKKTNTEANAPLWQGRGSSAEQVQPGDHSPKSSKDL